MLSLNSRVWELMAVEASQIRLLEETLNLGSHDLAKALGVAPITVSRWEEGSTTPNGLQAEVLQGLYSVALEIRQSQDRERNEMIRGLVVLGIGALIFYLLSRR